jgi:hypothetical protein
MTITQTVEIPADRRLHLDLEIPREVPTGKTNVVIQFPVRETAPQTAVPKGKAGETPHTDALLSLLSNIGEVNIDEIRDERLAKHLK